MDKKSYYFQMPNFSQAQIPSYFIVIKDNLKLNQFF